MTHIVILILQLLVYRLLREFDNFNTDCFLKRSASPDVSAETVSPASKKPTLSAKQGDVSAAFRAQEFSSSMVNWLSIE